MGKTLDEIAQQLKNSPKKVQLIYAFNGTGKTRLSTVFKKLISEQTDSDEDIDLIHNKILYYNAFTEDLFYWDNREYKLRVHPNSFINWILEEEGRDTDIIKNFQIYTNDKLMPKIELQMEMDDRGELKPKIPKCYEVEFSLASGDDAAESNIKISKGEESNFVWSVFYTLLQQVISGLNIVEPSDRSTDKFNDLEWVFIDDPVSSLDENHLIELGVDTAQLIKSSESGLKFVITTHNPLFYNVLHNELSNANKYFLKRVDDGSYDLVVQKNDSPFSYHLYLKAEIEQAIAENRLKKYHFNFLRNILEKTSTFLGYENWGKLLLNLPDVNEDNLYAYEKRIINISSHSAHSADEISELNENDKRVLDNLIKNFSQAYHFEGQK